MAGSFAVGAVAWIPVRFVPRLPHVIGGGNAIVFQGQGYGIGRILLAGLSVLLHQVAEGVPSRSFIFGKSDATGRSVWPCVTVNEYVSPVRWLGYERKSSKCR